MRCRNVYKLSSLDREIPLPRCTHWFHTHRCVGVPAQGLECGRFIALMSCFAAATLHGDARALKSAASVTEARPVLLGRLFSLHGKKCRSD